MTIFFTIRGWKIAGMAGEWTYNDLDLSSLPAACVLSPKETPSSEVSWTPRQPMF